MCGQSSLAATPQGSLSRRLPQGLVVPELPRPDSALQSAPPPISPAKTEAQNVFRAIRGSTRLSQRAFAQRFGIPLQTIRNLEQGLRRDGSRAVRFQYACVLADPDRASEIARNADALVASVTADGPVPPCQSTAQ